MTERIKRPACMDKDEMRNWNAANRLVYSEAQRAKSPCDDCPAYFALEMREENRCDGHPRGWQGDDDPSYIFSRPQRRSAEVRGAQRAKRAETARNLIRTGLSQVEVARTMGLSQSAISAYVREAR